MAEQYGASLEAWHHWSMTLGLAEHLLPVVSNPGATISPDSAVATLGKTPSRYNFRREVSGFAKWTAFEADLKDVAKWEREPDYGICVQARAVRAIDIDVPGVHAAHKIERTIREALPHIVFPRRYREKTGKVLLPFIYKSEMPKRMIPVEGGVIEFLGDGQQWVADASYIVNNTAGRRKDGRYLWDGGWPTAIPVLTDDELEALWDTLCMFYSTGNPTMARVRRKGQGIDTSAVPGTDDPLLDHVMKHWEVREVGRDGQVYLRCPFDDEHTSDSGPTETVYYPAGTGGYQRGHFKCLHAHCMDKSDADYIEALGFMVDLSDAPDLPALVEGEKPVEAPARFITDKQGRKENRPYNHLLFLLSDACGMRIALDQFTDSIVWCKSGDAEGQEVWREFRDEHYVQIVRQMDRHGFVPLAPLAIRPSVHDLAVSRQMDSAKAWLERLPKWDGTRRIGAFLPQRLMTDDTTYARAVGNYIWTALAGRVMQPGCKADMVPVLIGAQGLRKSTAVETMVPHNSMFVELDLSHRDADTARKLRGVLVAELGELKGLRSKEAEAIKAWIVAKEDQWIPKYKESKTTFKRRALFIGTMNPDNGFLNDPTGERRWLPFDVGINGEYLDIDGIEADREQLWAEGLARWRKEGVLWEPAESLAREEHHKYKEHDDWAGTVLAWIREDDPLAGGAPINRPYGWTAADALVGALGYRMREIKTPDKQRMGRVLTELRCLRKRTRGADGLDWRYKYEEPAENAEDEVVA